MIPAAVIVAAVAVLALVIVVATMGSKLAKRTGALRIVEGGFRSVQQELLQTRADHVAEVDRLEAVIQEQRAELESRDREALDGSPGSAREVLADVFGSTDEEVPS